MSGQEKKLITHRLAFFIMVCIANLACVEDLFNQGTCDWICAADTDLDKESSEMMVQGRLVKLKVWYEEQVDRECANQTDVTNSSTSASLWLKMASDKPRKKLQGRLQFSTLTIIEEFLSGQFPFGGYKEMNISCTFKSTSIKKPATEYSSRRLTFLTPHSTLYYVEHLANYTKSNTTFLTLLRTENITRLSVGVTSANGSLASANFASDNELTVSDGWLFVAVIIWIVFLLYSPVIFILFRPSEVSLPLARSTREARGDITRTLPLRPPVQATEDDGGFIDTEIREGHVPPAENAEDLNEDNELGSSQNNNMNSGSVDAHARSKIKGGFQEYVDRTTTDSVVFEETNKPSDMHSEMVGVLRRNFKADKVPKHRPQLRQTGDNDDLPQDLEDTNDSPALYGRLDINVRRLVSIASTSACDGSLKNETRPTWSKKSSTSRSVGTFDAAVSKRNDEELSGCINKEELNGFDANDEGRWRVSLRNVEDLNGYNSNKEELKGFDRNDEELSVQSNTDEGLYGSNSNNEEINDKELRVQSSIDEGRYGSNSDDEERNDEELSAQSNTDEGLYGNSHDEERSAQSNRNDEDASVSGGNNGTKIDGTGHVAIDMIDDSRQISENAQQESSVQSSDEEEETEYIPLVIVGETYPIGVGSFIGNKLFSSTNRNKLCNVVKLIFIFIVPLLFFTGIGDLFLVHLPNLHSRMAEHLPLPFLTSSVVEGAITNHPMVLFLVVFSAICYVIRLYFVCFCSSNTLKSALEPCSVHRMHPTCFTYKLLQCFFIRVSPPPKSICSFNSFCRRQHLKCAVCYWFFKTCLSYKPCERCENPAPPRCSKYLDLPQNISHNIEKLPDIIIKYWDSFFECVSKLGEKENIVTVIFSPLAVVPLIIDIFFSSPLVCLCYGRLWMLNERYKNKFRGSKCIFPTLECLLIFFSLVWVIFILFSSAVPLGVAIVGIIRVLSTHTYKVLPHLGIAVIAVHYFWSCYRSFTTPYRHLARTLASSYQKKFHEQEKMPGINLLIHYKQGEQGNHVKVIPKELFNDGCKDLDLPIRKKVASLICKLGLTLLVFLFVFPIISTDDVDPLHTTTVITFFAVAYNNVNDAINGDKFEVSQEDADEVVDNYIRRKQESS